MRFTISKKFTLLVLIFILVPLGFLGSHVYRVAKKSLQERIGQSMRMQASAMIEQIDRMLFERYQNVRGWAQEDLMFGIMTDDENKLIREFLTTLKKQYGLYEDIVVTDNSGKIVAATSPSLIGKSASGEVWFRKTSGQDEIMAGVQSGSKFMPNYGAIFAAPILTETVLKQIQAAADSDSEKAKLLEAIESWKPKTLGIVAAWINWSEIIEFVNSIPVIEEQNQSRDAYAVLISKEGLILSQPYFDNKAVLFREDLVKTGMEAARQASQGKSGYTVEVGRYGSQDFIGYAPSRGYRDFKGFGWSMLVFQSAEKALAPIKNLRLQIIGVACGVAFLAAALALFFARGLSRPIEKLAEFTRVIGRGDFSGSFPVQSHDEVGMLALSFNEMIANLRKTRHELISAHDFTDNIFKSIGEVLLVLDQNGKIQTINPAVEQILGYAEKDLKSLPIEKIFTPEFQSDEKSMGLIRRGEVLKMEAEFMAKDGTAIPMLFSMSVLRDQTGKSQGTVLIASDMREYKSLQTKFLEAQKMDAIGRLAGGVAHDFNNMLTVINGYSEDILIGKGAVELIPKKVGEVLKAGRRATRLVAQLLSFSRRQISKPAVVDINQIVQSMDKMLKLISGVRIQIASLLAHDLWPVKLDAGQFEQVLTNLTVNARDAMPQGGKLILETKNASVTSSQTAQHGLEGGDYVMVSIQDTGTGMTEEIKQRIFEPFFTTKPKGKGTGLGLATCFDFVKESKGFIEVETVLGKGTAFKLYFPRSEGKAQNLIDNTVEKELPEGTETILLVEDEDLVREFNERALSSLGYQVLQASNGADALQLAKASKQPVALLLTDVVMPGMDGRKLAEELLKFSPATKVIFISGYVEDEEFYDEVAKAGMTFMQKPVMTSTLAVKIREILSAS